MFPTLHDGVRGIDSGGRCKVTLRYRHRFSAKTSAFLLQTANESEVIVMLRYTGHPFFDVGVATVTAFSGKNDPSQVTVEDLRSIVEYMKREYPRDPLKSFLGVAFTNNAWFNQWAFETQPEKRADVSSRLLDHYADEEEGHSGEVCVFTGEPSTSSQFSDKLPPGRAFRQHIPLTTGEGFINFHPSGDAGLPISGKASVCMHAFPLGCAKCGGRLLAVHSDNPDLILEFAAKFLEENRKRVLLAQAAGSKKLAEAPMPARTLLLDTLTRAYEAGEDERSSNAPSSVTAYHLTNSGQSNPLDRRSPPLEIYWLPLEIMGFLRAILSSSFRSQWQKIAIRAWQLDDTSRAGKRNAGEGDGKEARPRRNYLYEDLFELPESASAFVRRYLLRIPERRAASDDPRRSYSLRDETELVSWGIADLFLREVIGMDKERVGQIRGLGDRLAQYVSGENDRRFFTTFYSEGNYNAFRNALIRADMHQVRNGGQPLIGLDSYIEVFEEGDEVARTDWRLARDLVLIRMVEELHRLGWLGKNADTLPVSKEVE